MPKILVIEDEKPLREEIVEMLSLEQFQVEEAASGQLGIALAQQRPDLILCDVIMPELDGYSVLNQIRQCDRTATIPFIFLTAKANRRDLRQGMTLGADDYLVKPFTRQELLQAIATQFAKRTQIDRTMQQQLDELRRSIALSLPHELHTPLAGIIGMSELLGSEYSALTAAEVEEMLDTIHQSALRLYRLTQNFLLYAELELAAHNVDRSMPDLVPVEADLTIAEAALHIVDRRDRQADLQLDLMPIMARITDSKLHKIVEELVDNACKFSPAGTPIAVVCRAQPFCLEVRDRGRGMTSEQITRIGAYIQFERKLHEQQGSGLGLAIAQRLSQSCGGKLSIDSTSEGTIVRVCFNLSHPA